MTLVAALEHHELRTGDGDSGDGDSGCDGGGSSGAIAQVMVASVNHLYLYSWPSVV